MGGDFGFRPRIRLLDQELQLNSETIATIRAIEAEMAARSSINLWLHPNWTQAQPTLSRILQAPPAAPAAPLVPRGAGPATPRPGELSDFLDALWRVPFVQQQVGRAHGEARRQLSLLGREWDGASTGERVTMVTMGGLVAGSSLAILLANPQTREPILNLVLDRDIPVPGVRGLTLRLQRRGGQVTAPLGVPGLTGTAGFGVGTTPGRAVDYNVMINFDVVEFLRSRRASP